MHDYGRELLSQLRAAGLRVTLDAHSDKLGAKIRRAESEKVPYTLVFGGREAVARTVSVRSRARGDEGAMSADALAMRVRDKVRTRALPGGRAAG